MPPPSKQTSEPHQSRPSKDPDDGDEEEDQPSHNLWVGNLSSDTVDSDLLALFEKYGALDSVATYASRNFAFVYFKHLDDAKAAKEALQGVLVHGNPVKIEFARPAKPGKHLWIGGISSSVTKEQLEDELLKFGKIEEYKFLRDRNSALVYFYKIDDAVAAVKGMNGTHLGGEQIRVDYLRSQPSKKDWSDHHDSRDGHFSNKRAIGPSEPLRTQPDSTRNYPETSHYGHKRILQSGVRRDGQPSKTLWIGYPPSVQIDEQMLHNAMILFGEIERIDSFPSRHYSFVEFRSIDEARRAKEGLQGRLFNDPRIQILFSNSELARKDDSLSFPGSKGHGPDMFFNEPPFGRLELFGPGRPMVPTNFFGRLPPNSMHGTNMLGRPSELQGHEGLHGGSDLLNDNDPMAGNWRRLSPGMWPPLRPLPGVWDGPDIRDTKRSRMDGPSPFRESFGLHLPDGGASNQRHYSPVAMKGPLLGLPGQSEHFRAPDSSHCWRGIIAKGGTPVCHARCVPVGRGIDSLLPEVVNCSARTGLDMLTKHYAEASGFDIVFFLPNSEDDFASYTEFLRYLALKNRAGVAKLDDGTTLFLVPPSNFLTKVLNVAGPERLYGVVLKMVQQNQPQEAIPPPVSHYIDSQRLPPSQNGYGLVCQDENQSLKMEYDRVLQENPTAHTEGGKPFLGHADESRLPPSILLDYATNPAATLPVEVSLTPEVIGTLASHIPTNVQSTATGPAQASSFSVRLPAFPTSVIGDKVTSSHLGWNQEIQVPVSDTLHQEQLGHQFSNQTAHLSQFPMYPNILNGPNHSGQPNFGSAQVQDPAMNAQQAASIPSRPLNNYAMPSQGGQFSAPQGNQHYQLGAGFGSDANYLTSQVSDTTGIICAPALQQPESTIPAQVHSGSMPQHPIVTHVANDKVNTDFSAQVQQLQNALTGSGQGTSGGDADKNQRYQSTLQFAASLLLQIQHQQQQQQQQATSQAVQGSGNQQ